jgi:hypothetical protein
VIHASENDILGCFRIHDIERCTAEDCRSRRQENIVYRYVQDLVQHLRLFKVNCVRESSTHRPNWATSLSPGSFRYLRRIRQLRRLFSQFRLEHGAQSTSHAAFILCYRTAAHEKTENALHEDESKHMCESLIAKSCSGRAGKFRHSPESLTAHEAPSALRVF